MPLQRRIEAADQCNLYWQLRLALSEDVPSLIVSRWLSREGAHAPATQMFDLLHARPDLLEPALKSPMLVASAAASCLHLDDAGARLLIRRCDMRTLAGRAAARELAINPQLGGEVREEALALTTRHRSRAERELLADLSRSTHVRPGPHVDFPGLDLDSQVSLAFWASGIVSRVWTPSDDATIKPAVWEALTQSSACRAAVDYVLASGPVQMPRLESRLESRVDVSAPSRLRLDDPLLSHCPEPVLLAAAACWHSYGHSASDYLTQAAAAETCRWVLGDDVHAWEAYVSLSRGWAGTLGELLGASRAL